MNILLLGSGGREHALAWKLLQSSAVTALYCAPGNPGTESLVNRYPGKHVENVSVKIDAVSALTEFAVQKRVDLTVVGPELPLACGVVDELRARGLRVFGPTKAAARLESSKAFAKEVLLAAKVPTARAEVVSSEGQLREAVGRFGVPIVLKADQLAAGKGVFVCLSHAEVAEATLQLFGSLGSRCVVVEEYLTGNEVSFIIATDGEQVIPFASSHDYKRVADGQTGPNTGGMGAVSPSPYLPKERTEEAISTVIRPILVEMKKRGTPFAGFLYAGLMISESGRLSVLEYNVRMGDPETQPLMRRCRSDLATFLADLADGKPVQPLEWSEEAAVCVVMAAEGYPGDATTGDVIAGFDKAANIPGCEVFHAGTKRTAAGDIVTSGGRVLGVTGCGTTIEEARKVAYAGCECIQFRGQHRRGDIGR